MIEENEVKEELSEIGKNNHVKTEEQHLSCFQTKQKDLISFTRDDLLNIRQKTPQNLLWDFDYSDLLLDIVVGGAIALVNRFRTRRRGHFYIGERWCTDVTV